MPEQPTSIVIFAQTPPPEHGQSRMVQLALDTLRSQPGHFDVHHVNARFSETIEDIGSSTLGKGLRMFGFIRQLVRLRCQLSDPLLYYVPGPAKWSAVIRDWVLLGILRILYRKTVFHWHAIGHGEWAHGSERLVLDGPEWIIRVARLISRHVLDRPFASICVSPTSRTDSLAVSSIREFTVCNGIEDPCPDYDSDLAHRRAATRAGLTECGNPHFRILFLSHGTEEKGLFDAIEALRETVSKADADWSFSVTFAGGVSESLEERFQNALSELRSVSAGRLNIRVEGYVSGEDKARCYREHDIYLAASRWESFGLTVVEAMAYGMQVVAAASDGVKGVLSEEHPYLSPPASPMALAGRLLECCHDMASPSQLAGGEKLRQRFLDHFQLKDFSHNLKDILLSLTAETDACELSSGGVLPPRAHTHETPEITSYEKAESCTDGVSPPPDNKPNVKPPTVIDRRYSENDPFILKACALGESAPPDETPSFSPAPFNIQHSTPGISLQVYLADQNPGFDRSIGISRMTQSVISALKRTGKVSIHSVSSRSSQGNPEDSDRHTVLPWDTRSKWVRFLTDHLHPLLPKHAREPAAYYYPKGYLPLFSNRCRPSVVTIHDTIIQHDRDHYPNWRSRWEYGYWSWALRHTLRHVDRIMTISDSSKQQIEEFMRRHRIPRKEIHVTYEPCAYESIPQPQIGHKDDYVLHLGSREPHKKTAFLIKFWHESEQSGRNLPPLHLIGSYPSEASDDLAGSTRIQRLPFLADATLQEAYRSARALILPSEIEGFGLPALEAYYLGTPVCFVKGTSVEEILSVATAKGGFSLEDPESLFHALEEVLAMSPEEIRNCGLKLRETYASGKVAERMLEVFDHVKNLQF